MVYGKLLSDVTVNARRYAHKVLRHALHISLTVSPVFACCYALRMPTFISLYPAVSALTRVLLLLACASAPTHAMEFKRMGATLILSGEVVARDLDRVKAEFKTAPTITHVVLRNSMGGNSWTGYRLGELFREHGVTTAVSGHCISSCSRLFLGGKQRMFSDDYPASLTFVGFHGHYDFGKLNAQAVEQNDQLRWTIKYTDGKVDPKLLQRWTRIEKRAGDARFYPAAVTAFWKDASFLCEGSESSKPTTCERLGTTGLAQGIVTTAQFYSSADASTLPFKKRATKYPTTSWATLTDGSKLPGVTAALRKDYEQFIRSAVPRAFAVSANGKQWAWNANDAQSAERSVARCQAKSTTICRLYAVDDRVVFRNR